MNNRSMTEGSIVRLLLLFTLPLLVGNIFQQFYSMADTFIVGRTIGVDALAAVGSTGSISFLLIGFAQGFTSGLSIRLSGLVLGMMRECAGALPPGFCSALPERWCSPP